VECRAVGGCPTGQARITKGYRLAARHVIHTVGPVWHGGDRDEDALLASCYRESLALARAHGIRTLAFPAISTGVYGFPIDHAARIAVRTIGDELHGRDDITEVRLVCFGDAARQAADAALAG
jgi:O-acetyl-ADP-ribose deacetylase (regulator of RNase III)